MVTHHGSIRNAGKAPAENSGFWVLVLSKGLTRLLQSVDGELTEIEDTSFPVRYIEQFQFEQKTGPQIQYYDDESWIDEVRMLGFYRHVTHLFLPYLKGADLPIVLLTTRGHAGDFKRASRLNDSIVGVIYGNYDHHSVPQLKELLETRLANAAYGIRR